ncbi:MAG: hypothetical protein ACR2H1_02975 [Limisphaerales bacterium]
MTTLLQTRVDQKVAAKFQKAAKQRGLSPYAFLQKIVTDAASLKDSGSLPASVELSRDGFTLPELPMRTYSDEDKAMFLLNNACSRVEYKKTRDSVRKMGLNPDKIKHHPWK